MKFGLAHLNSPTPASMVRLGAALLGLGTTSGALLSALTLAYGPQSHVVTAVGLILTVAGISGRFITDYFGEGEPKQ